MCSHTLHTRIHSAQGFDTKAWDWDVMHGCLCDSSWAVGYNTGETQLAEYFGADCSLSEYIFTQTCIFFIIMSACGV